MAGDLKTSKTEVAALKANLESKNSRLGNVEAFQLKANSIMKKHNIRLTKAVIKTTAGEIVAWITAVGDAASVYFAIDGTIAMCDMFQELEATAVEYGLPFYIYTDTFCEKPVEKTKEVVTSTVNDITTSVGRSLRTQFESRTDYWSGTIEDFVNWING